MKYESDMGDALVAILEATERYATAYKREFGDNVGTDYVLREGVVSILQGVDALLNGPLGRHDGGRLSSEVHRIAQGYECADKNGEVG